jgi:hypothetical protein
MDMEELMVSYDVLSQHLPVGTEKYQEKPYSG